ncbi:uncharacterized protein Nmag_1171 [Natrialba magadii ATCC 43099]|uniref:Uncharacterized protein n=1 Tax=Natrialba magadii (strain ATCC 43099 / DSM 3394 / CCM 3739 / CIP 104546 / IAM 13178 / JCM 8861 / NBRC 102185 / NCIMB 2190 / MS3) TaxID=547559 RepID=D3SS29_NATMM|nr:bacteriophage holin [Natrialba magadii]ADD04755.1 uncharacterized protein Nmag_1171 [Natrialba magadii ATCC 43099]ELY24922.1 hypothetical protein C500_18378 [Natrialba magadii ATCC 43099]
MTGPIDTRALGLASGIFWALLIAVLELTAGTGYGERWRLLFEDIYPGYDRTPGDLLWGTTLAFVDGFSAGVSFGWLYNRLAE